MRLRLVGQTSLQEADGTHHVLATRDALLLGRLALDGPQDRQRLVEWLWPDTRPAQARTNLRQRLLRLRRTHGCDLVVGGTRLSLDPALAGDWCDPLAALRANPDAVRGDWLGALTCRPNERDIDGWLFAAREHWRRQCHAALQTCAEEAGLSGDLPRAMTYLRRLCAEDPLHEGHHRQLMQLHLRHGEPGIALAVYARVERRLREELGLAPHPLTTALAHQATHGDPARNLTIEGPRPPCFDGTAVPVQRLFDVLQSGGASLDDFLRRFPSVSRPAALSVLRSAQAHWLADPHRGRTPPSHQHACPSACLHQHEGRPVRGTGA